MSTLVRLGRERPVLDVAARRLEDLRTHHARRPERDRERLVIGELRERLRDDGTPFVDEVERAVRGVRPCRSGRLLVRGPERPPPVPRERIQPVVPVRDDQAAAGPEHAGRLGEEGLVVEIVRDRFDREDRVDALTLIRQSARRPGRHLDPVPERGRQRAAPARPPLHRTRPELESERPPHVETRQRDDVETEAGADLEHVELVERRNASAEEQVAQERDLTAERFRADRGVVGEEELVVGRRAALILEVRKRDPRPDVHRVCEASTRRVDHHAAGV